MATKKVTTATTKDVTAKVTAPVTKTSEKAETTKKAETVKAVAATEPKKIEKEPVKTAAPKAEPVKPTTKEEIAKPEAKKAEKKVEDKAVKTESVKKAEAETKTAAKKTTTKKTTARKTTAKKEIKVSAFVEYFGKQVEEKEMIARVKKAWTSSGKKIGDIKTMELYIKPEESAVYYVINGTETGAVAF